MPLTKPDEILDLTVITYDDLIDQNPESLSVLSRALHENGIVAVRGIPGYREKALQFIDAARKFSALAEAVKEAYAPNRSLGELFLGYEKGKEKFQRPDGTWVIDDLKVSYYGFIPDDIRNKWPSEVDLRSAFQDLGKLMADVGEAVMISIGLVGPKTKISLDGIPRIGRMLYYSKIADTSAENPLWCGSHYDHGLFTALLPAFYFLDGKEVEEPLEAGLFIKTTNKGSYQKVVANDPEILLFQVGEFAQLITDDRIRATEHRVHKALGNIERYTMAVFYEPPMETVIHSFSALTQDPRYKGKAGDPCTYQDWSEETFKRFLAD